LTKGLFAAGKSVGFQLHELTPGGEDKSSVLSAKAAASVSDFDRFPFDQLERFA
jgi:hypothetical protein